MPTPVQVYSSIVYDTCIAAGVPDANAQIIVAQARHESGDFSSNVFLSDNNCFGMKVPHVRKSRYILGAGTAAPASEGDRYAHYGSVQDCVLDLIDLLSYEGVQWDEVATPDDYAAWLKSKGYYGDTQSNYTSALNRFMAEFSAVYQAGASGIQAGVGTMQAAAIKYKSYLPLLIGITVVGIGLYIVLKERGSI